MRANCLGVTGVVNFLEPEPCTDGQDKDESATVGVRFSGESGPLSFS
jgi:hypothetical protein